MFAIPLYIYICFFKPISSLLTALMAFAIFILSHILLFLRSIYNEQFRVTRKPTWQSAALNTVPGRF